MIKGVIFDFNGTLYLDHDINRIAWEGAFNSVKPKSSSAKYSDINRGYSPNDYLLCKVIYRHFNIEPTDQMIKDLSILKETEYKNLAIKRNMNKLVEGSEQLFRFLKEHNIPYCIASMAPKMNMDFYLDYLHLDKWFSYDNIVYDNGTYFEKNSQYKDAAKKMNLNVSDCLIIEDTPKNIVRAINGLHLNKFIYINTRNIEYIAKEILQEIKDYTEIDYKIFTN